MSSSKNVTRVTRVVDRQSIHKYGLIKGHNSLASAKFASLISFSSGWISGAILLLELLDQKGLFIETVSSNEFLMGPEMIYPAIF